MTAVTKKWHAWSPLEVLPLGNLRHLKTFTHFSLLFPALDSESPRGFSWEFLVGSATRSSKSWPFFIPKNAIFHIRFQTWSLKSIPILRLGFLEPQQKDFLKSVSACYLSLSPALFFGGREATTGNTSAVCRLSLASKTRKNNAFYVGYLPRSGQQENSPSLSHLDQLDSKQHLLKFFYNVVTNLSYKLGALYGIKANFLFTGYIVGMQLFT